MEFKRLDLTTEVKAKDRKKYLVAGEVKTFIRAKGFKKVFVVDEPMRVLPELSPHTRVVVRKNGAPFTVWTQENAAKYGYVLDAGKYAMEVTRA
jgi:hypothetical protein